MNSLNCLSINKPQIPASALPNKSSPSLPTTKPSNPTIASPKLQQRKQKQRSSQRKPTVLEIERAIGAGIFRDRDTDRESEENKTLFDTLFLNSIGKTEGSVEKQLRETGEWITEKSERNFRSAGKPILMFIFQWMLPMWILAFLIASGFIKLPFDSPLLDDLIL